MWSLGFAGGGGGGGGVKLNILVCIAIVVKTFAGAKVQQKNEIRKKKRKKSRERLHISKKSCTFAADFEKIAPQAQKEDGFDCLQPHEKNAKKSRKSKDKRQELKQPCGCFFWGI